MLWNRNMAISQWYVSPFMWALITYCSAEATMCTLLCDFFIGLRFYLYVEPFDFKKKKNKRVKHSCIDWGTCIQPMTKILMHTPQKVEPMIKILKHTPHEVAPLFRESVQVGPATQVYQPNQGMPLIFPPLPIWAYQHYHIFHHIGWRLGLKFKSMCHSKWRLCTRMK